MIVLIIMKCNSTCVCTCTIGHVHVYDIHYYMYVDGMYKYIPHAIILRGKDQI